MNREENSHESQKPAIRISTLVWGAMLIVIGVLLGIAQFTSVQLDLRAVLIGLLLLAGLALLVGGVCSAALRARKRRNEVADTLER